MAADPLLALLTRRGALVGAVSSVLWSACARVPLVNSLRGGARPPGSRAAFEQLSKSGGITTLTRLPDNPGAWSARWQCISAARNTIDASYFIVEPDVFGVAFLGALYVKALAGVKIRLIIDARGSMAMSAGVGGGDYLQELARVGVHIHIFNPPLPNVLRALVSASLIPISAGTHNKTLVVDDKTAITGGRNIGAGYFAPVTENPAAYLDLDLLLTGADTAQTLRNSVTAELEASEQWGNVPPELLDLIPRGDELLMVHHGMQAWLEGSVSLLPADLALVELEETALRQMQRRPDSTVRARARAWFEELVRYTSVWGTLKRVFAPEVTAEVRVVSGRSRAQDNDDTLNASLMRCFGAARKRILIESPYFVLTPRLLASLQSANDNGVRILVMTNSAQSSDNDPAQSLFIDTAPELLARMKHLRLFVARDQQTRHLKRIIIDDELTLVGTYNIDPFSAHLNSETLVGIWSPAFNDTCSSTALSRMKDALEYRLLRDSAGQVKRYPAGHPNAGEVEMAFGPRDHVTPERLEELARVRALLISIRNMWDFDVVTF